MTLSTPVKVIALAGLAVILAAGGFLTLAAKHGHAAATPATVAAPPKVITVSTNVVTHHAAPAKPKLQLDPSLPAPVRAKLQHSKTVVAFVYTSLAASDRAELADVRAGAHQAHVPFVALDVTHERIADAVYTWTQSAADPQVLVVKRPGTIAFQVAGLTDQQTIAQAAANIR
jgi:hypothetical protein